MVLSVPPGVEPRRVSVDAIEHWMIYQEHPEVGAIVHVHAWVDGIEATDVNYPCGTGSLRVALLQLVREDDDPAQTRSSASATTASPSPARASRRSSTASSRVCSARSPS